jgi:plasmid maintenance system antidote protein VapI
MELINKDLHVGKILKKYLTEKNIAQAVLARRLKIKDKMVVYYVKKAHFSTEKLLAMSEVLKRNLFADIALQLPEQYGKSQPELEILKQEIATLQEENKILNAKLELLERIMKRN